MLKTTRKNNIVIMAMIILLSIMMAFVFCNFNVASAEENSEANVVNDIESYAIDMGDLTKDTLNVGVTGTFVDGKRIYAAYFMEVCVKRLDSTTYKINTKLNVVTLDWKTDRYRIDQLSYRFYADDNIKLTQRKVSISNAEGDTPTGNVPTSGFSSVDIRFNNSNKKNNHTTITEEITAKVDGTGKFYMDFNGVEVRGLGLAKNTKITNSIAKVRVQPSTVMGMYKPFYAYNGAYIQDAAYTSQFGPVPSDWIKSANINAI